MIIAIDGPAGSGKSTIAREVAKKLGMRYLDTGAMYRAVTLLALEAGLVPHRLAEAGAVAGQANLRLEGRPDDLSRVFVGGREVTDEIRGREVSQNVSAVSADPGVRAVLTRRQREEAARGDVVLEGRDMGTVVVPGAEVKVFLTASIEERARRRQAQLQAQGRSQPLEELISDITKRDALDSERAVAPLRKAHDAIEIDTTRMTITEVVAAVCALAEKARGEQAGASTSAGAEKPRKWLLSRMYKTPLDTALYRATFRVLGPLWRLMYRMRVKGAENVPLTGPVVIVCNHKAMTDPFFLGINVPRQIHYMAKAELWKYPILRWAMEGYGTFPVKRGEADRGAIKRGIEILEAGAILGLFPEGRVTRECRLGPMRSGISLFCAREGVVTVPAVLRGTDRVIRHGIPRFPRIDLVIGPPLELPGPEVPRSKRGDIISERVAAALSELLDTPAG
jgi:cytidylate kinase